MDFRQENNARNSLVTDDSIFGPSTSGLSTFFKICPKDVHSLSKISQRQRTTKIAKSGDTVVLTSTPYKDHSVEEQTKKIEQEEKKPLKINKKTLKKHQMNVTKPHPTINRVRKGRKAQVEEDGAPEAKNDAECPFCSEQFLQSAARKG